MKLKNKWVQWMMIMLLLAACMTLPVHNVQAKAKVQLSQKSVVLEKKKTKKVTLKGTKKKVKWSTSNKKVATVSKSGVIKAKKAGSVKIYAKQGKKTYTCKVIVPQKTYKLTVGKTQKIKTTKVKNRKWTTSNKKVATVSKTGIVTAKKSGTAVITLRAGKKTSYFKVVVTAKKPETPDTKEEERQVVSKEIAALFGVEPGDGDHDGDGLSNYIEIYVTQTDPTLVDSDGNGVKDIDEDADKDGLTNGEELKLGTNLGQSDSDGDGLSDYVEVRETRTNPLKPDTDGDGLSDGDEVVLGLNPLTQKTDGRTKDSERKFKQKLDTEQIDEQLVDEENAAIPSLELIATGNINSRISMDVATDVEYGDSRAITGKPVEVQGENIGNGKISFTLQKENAFSYDEGENTTIICRYNKDGSVSYLKTYYDEENSRITTSISEEGTYFVLDGKVLFNELGLSFPETGWSMLEEKKSVAKAGASVMAQADIVFLVDTTGSMGDEIANVKNNVEYFIDTLKEKGVSSSYALIDYQDITYDGMDSTKIHKNGSSNWFYNPESYKEAIAALSLGDGGDTPECVVDALETARLLDMRPSTKKIFVLVTDADYKEDNRYGIESMHQEIELLKNSGITCAVVSPSSEQSTYSELYTQTNGIWANIYGNFYQELTALAERIGDEIVGDGYWIYLDGVVPIPVCLEAEPKEGSTVDTDKDGLTDVNELADLVPTKEIDLDALVRDITNNKITGTAYGKIKMYRYKSDPTRKDTDFDGTDDKQDSKPKNNNCKGVMHYKMDSKDKNETTSDITFTVDYRNIITSNSGYSKDLSKISILHAFDVYDDSYVTISEGARTGGNDNAITFGSLLGLADSKAIKLSSSDYSVDKDDISEIYVGHRKFEYNGVDNEVIVVAVRGTNGTNAEWSSNFDVGADTSEYYEACGWDHPDWKNKNHHKGFDVAANRLYTKLMAYIRENVDMSAKKNILISGHSRGAAIANILGTYFEDLPEYNAHTYTFATPNTTVSSNTERYKTIYNIVNTDDLIPYMPIEKWNFSKHGTTRTISIEEYYEDKSVHTKKENYKANTWEWFVNGSDYNNDGGTQRTLDAFGKVARNREELYALDSSGDGKVWENNAGHVTRKGAEEELKTLTQTLTNEKLLKFCKLSVVGGGISYHVEVNYSPAYLMQSLANMTTGVGPLLGHDVKGKYASAKSSFVASSGKVVVGGMTHPHMPVTYYLIANNDFSRIQ